MERSTIILALGFAFTGAAVAAASCTFPEIAIKGDTSGSGGSGASASTGSSSTASSSSTGGHTGSSSTGTVTGTGGASSSSTSSSSTSASSSSGGVKCPLDVDMDLVLSWKCDGGTDCADDDGAAHPGASFQSTAIKGELQHPMLPFDFNCNGVEEAETPTLNCGGCDNRTGFQADVACGMTGKLGTCVGIAVNCTWTAKSPTMTVIQRCK